MDTHDDWTELLERMKRFKGEFAVNGVGEIRHRTRTALAPDWLGRLYDGPAMACPLNALCQVTLAELDEVVPVLENGDFADMATILDVPPEYVERFARAADNPYDSEVGALRDRIIESVC